MKLLRLRITQFGSFLKTQTFEFPKVPGLYFIRGENAEEPRLEANGSGKTTMWRALTWLFFGKDSRGLKASDVANWDGAKGTAVEVDLEDSGKLYTVRRSHAPNSWTMWNALFHPDQGGSFTDLTKDETNKLQAKLRLAFQPFLSCVLMAQGQPMFLDLKAEAKAALFAEVMQLDKWIEYSEKASAKAKAHSTAIQLLETRISELRGRIAANREVDLKAQHEEWEDGRKARLARLDEDYDRLITRLKDLKERAVEKKVVAEELRNKYREALEGSEDLQTSLVDLRKGFNVIDKAIAEMEGISDHMRRKTIDGKCYVCGQSLSDHTGDEIEREIQEKEAEIAKHRRTLNKVGREVDTKEAIAATAARATREALTKWDAAEATYRAVEREVDSVGKSTDQCEDRAEAVEKEVNPYANMMGQERDTMQRLQEDLAELTEQLDEREHRYSINSSLVRWFKEIRLALIGDALQQLEIEVNSCVNALGLVNWELRFEVDKESKAGTIQRGFNVTVLSPHNPKPVPWEAWSGGEAQRLRLAGNMGLGNLIRARTGATLNLEVWDEPTQHMSGQGVADLLDSLKARSRAEHRVIFVVDHRTLGYSDFDKEFVVRKTADGSKFLPKRV